MTNPEVEFYKFMKPKEAHRLPPDLEYYGESYRGFMVAKDSEMFLWSIEAMDDTPLPLDLRGTYTNGQLAKDHIDAFLAQQEKHQRAKEMNEG